MGIVSIVRVKSCALVLVVKGKSFCLHHDWKTVNLERIQLTPGLSSNDRYYGVHRNEDRVFKWRPIQHMAFVFGP